MQKIRSLAIRIILLLSISSVAYADSPLNVNDIQYFMKVMPPLQLLGQKYNFENGAEQNQIMDINNFTPMSNALEIIQTHKAFSEFQSIIHTAGFSSPQHWATVGDRIMRAYISLQTAKNMTPKKIQDMTISIEEMNKNEYLSLETKQNIQNNLNNMIEMVRNTPQDIKNDQETLKPFLTQLERLFEEQQ
ncbi:MAG: hypothetical protein K9G26_00285 [Emcibacter sp.]|nr:hypothetical protein [Emcibacter sp.]